jgi:fumarate reductase flavoprotein subunit
LALDMQSGEPVLIHARATLFATGGEPDGMAMALRAGVPLRDMESATATGGVLIAPSGATAMLHLYAAGDVTGGLHGVARLEANTLAAAALGAVAGESLAKAVRKDEPFAEPNVEILEIAHERAFSPLRHRRSDLPAVRRRLVEITANEMGVARSMESLARARHALNNLASGVSGMGVPDTEPRNNGIWMERLDLENLILVTRAVCGAMNARLAEPATNRFTVVRANEDERIDATTEPVRFTRVKPGESLLSQATE